MMWIAITYVLVDYRQQFQAEHPQVVETLHWEHPGAVWAIDHSQPPRSNDEPLASTSLGGGPDHHENGMSVRIVEMLERYDIRTVGDVRRLGVEGLRRISFIADKGSQLVAQAVGLEICRAQQMNITRREKRWPPRLRVQRIVTRLYWRPQFFLGRLKQQGKCTDTEIWLPLLMPGMPRLPNGRYDQGGVPPSSVDTVCQTESRR